MQDEALVLGASVDCFLRLHFKVCKNYLTSVTTIEVSNTLKLRLEREYSNQNFPHQMRKDFLNL